ncbi:hypothetical protein L218DRAFT_490444 [Marasmius fiardii PR-910]|nr:hypothetical protein L218DRAFT_490444 [Marasmius fiardii PR-910]
MNKRKPITKKSLLTSVFFSSLFLFEELLYPIYLRKFLISSRKKHWTNIVVVGL